MSCTSSGTCARPTPHAVDPSLDGVSFPGISCPGIIWSFVQMTGSQCCDVMWPQMRSVVCVCGDVIKRKQQAKPTEKQRTKYFAKCTENQLDNTKNIEFGYHSISIFGALGHLWTILGPPWDSKGSGIRSRIPMETKKSPLGPQVSQIEAPRSFLGRVSFWTRVWTPL